MGTTGSESAQNLTYPGQDKGGKNPRCGDVGREGEDPAAHRLCSNMPGATYFFQRSNKVVEIDTVNPQIGEGLKYFQITEFPSLLLFFQVSVTQLC